MTVTCDPMGELRHWIALRNPAIDAAAIEPTTPLIEQGYLQSLQVADLILFIEQLRGAEVDVTELRAGVFRDLDTIHRTFLAPSAPATEPPPAPAPPAPRSGRARGGEPVLTGPDLALFERLDATFVELAGSLWSAPEYRFPIFIDAAELDRVDYFRSFPHLATFPVTLDRDEANLARFCAGDPVGPDGSVSMPAAAAVREVLTPAACYHAYVHFQGTELDRPLVLTTRNRCFRNEDEYAPLRRQWSFSMREIICMGTRDEVLQFLERTAGAVDELTRAWGLRLEWDDATDPFFRPSANAKYVMQKVNPTKRELIFGGDLAIGSVNLHQDHFGRAFDIRRRGQPAYSGCVAFGVERWLHALLTRFGADAYDVPS